MPEAVIYQDYRVTVTTDTVRAGEVSCPIAAISQTMVTGSTGIEEKIFLGIIAFFGVAIALVGVLLEDTGELALGIGLASVTTLIIRQKCTLRLVTPAGKVAVLTDRDVRYIRLVRDKIEDAMGLN